MENQGLETQTAPVSTDAPAASVTPSGTAPEATPTFNVPEEYKGKGWVDKVKSEGDLWKQLDNAQSLLGKKSVAPDFANAKPEEISSYFEQLRPKDMAEYQLDVLGEDKAEFAKMFYEAGLSKYQADKMAASFKTAQESVLKEMYSDEVREELLKKELGAEYKQITEQLSNVLGETLTADEIEVVNKMPAKMQVVFAKALNKFGATQQVNASPLQNQNGAKADAAVRFAEGQKLLSDLQKRPHTDAEKQAIINQYFRS